MAPRARVQVRDLRAPEPIQPAPIQSSTFSGAPRVSGAGDNFLALAQALGGFSQSLGQLAQAQEANKKKDVSLENAFSRLTKAEQAQVARTGMLPDGTRISDSKNPALMKAAGMADASMFVRSMQEELTNEFDWENTDIDAWITERRDAWMQEQGITDQFAANGFLAGVNSFRDKLISQQDDYRAGRAEEVKGDVVYNVMHTKVNELLEAGTDPEQLHKTIRAMYPELGKQGTIGMDFDKLDRFTLSIAADIAATHPEHALAILDSEREGAGPASASLSSKLKHKGTVDAIRGTAQRSIAKRESLIAENQVHVDNAMRVLRDGDTSPFQERVIPNESGTGTKKVTVKEQEDEYVSAVVALAEQEMKDDKLGRGAADRKIIQSLRPMGLKMPFLEKEIDGIEKRIDPDVLQDPQQLKAVTDRIQRFRDLKEASPSYANSHLSEDTKDFIGTVEMFMRFRGQDMPSAILTAQRVNSGELGQDVSLSYHRDAIEDAVEDAFDDYAIRNSTNYSSFNKGAAIARVEKMAQKLYASGEFTVEEAIEKAAGYIAESVPKYNNRIIPGLEQFPLMENWTEGLDQIMSNFKKQLHPGLADVEELHIMPVGGGRFAIIDEDGIIMRNADGQPMATSVPEINDVSKTLAAEKKNTLAEETVKQNKRYRKARTPREGVSPSAISPLLRPSQQAPSLWDDLNRGN